MGESQSKSFWEKDADVLACNGCGRSFTLLLRRHHCRNCGKIFCFHCSSRRCPIPMRELMEPARVCDACYRSLYPTTAPPPAQATQQETRNPTNHAATAPEPATVSPPAAPVEPEISEEQRKYEEYCQSLYGGSGAGPRDGDEGTMQFDGDSAPHQMGESELTETERLQQRWNTVRQSTVFVDIVLQRADRVQPNTEVEYSRETESLSLQPEVSTAVLGTAMLPLPQPSEESARYLMEPVRSPFQEGPIRTAFTPTTVLAKTCAELADKLRITTPEGAVCRARVEDFLIC